MSADGEAEDVTDSGIYQYAIREYASPSSSPYWVLLPVVGETFDGIMSDIAAMPITPDFVVRGIDQAASKAVPQGNTGGGTGMLCSGFKAGTGTSSRVIKGRQPGPNRDEEKVDFTIAALVQTNFGKKDDLTFRGVPIGRLHTASHQPTTPWSTLHSHPKEGSIIVILATSAPLNPLQLQRLAKRATVGLSRIGGWGSNTSGDIFLAFSTGVSIPHSSDIWSTSVGQGGPVIFDETINALFEAGADVTEEAIMNSLCMSESIEGPEGRKAEAIDLDWLKETMERYSVSVPYLHPPHE